MSPRQNVNVEEKGEMRWRSDPDPALAQRLL